MLQLQQQARLADAGLAHDAHHLAAAGLDLREQVAERAQLPIAPHEMAEWLLARLEGRAALARAGDRVERHRRGEPADLRGPARLERRVAAHQAGGGVAQQDLAGGGQLLKSRGQVRGVAHRGVVHAQVVADGPDHHEAGVQPEADV